MEPFQLEIDAKGRLNYVYNEPDGFKSVYEVIGFKADSSLNCKFLHREKPKEDEGEGPE